MNKTVEKIRELLYEAGLGKSSIDDIETTNQLAQAIYNARNEIFEIDEEKMVDIIADYQDDCIMTPKRPSNVKLLESHLAKAISKAGVIK